MSGEPGEEEPEGGWVREVGGVAGFRFIRSDEDGGAGIELLFHHPLAEDSHPVLVGGRVENFVGGKMGRLRTHGFARASAILDEDEVAE